MTIKDLSSNLCGHWESGKDAPKWLQEAMVVGQKDGRKFQVTLDWGEMAQVLAACQGQLLSLGMQLQAKEIDYSSWLADREQLSRITLYMRGAYAAEMAGRIPPHNANLGLAECVIHYLKRERRTVRAVARRALFRLLGGGR